MHSYSSSEYQELGSQTIPHTISLPSHDNTSVRTPHKGLTAPLKPGSLRATVLALSTSALGAGIFTMPFAFQEAGLLLGSIMLLSSASVACLSTSILMSSIKEFGCDSYSSLASTTIGKSAGVFVDVMVTFNGGAVGVVFLMFLGDFIPDILRCIFNSAPFFSSSTCRTIVIVSSVLIMYPFAAKKGYGGLKNVTLIYVASILLTVAIVAVKCPFLLAKALRESTTGSGLKLVDLNKGCCKAFNICLFGFMQHQNVIPISKDMLARTWKKTAKVAVTASFVETFLYITLGICGYLSFLGDTRQNFINNYSEYDVPILVCRCLLSGCLLLAIPMCMISTGISLRQLFSERRGTTAIIYTSELGISDEALLSPSARVREKHYRRISIAAILFLDLSVAILTHQVADIISLIGGCISVTLMCGLPLLIYHSGMGKKAPLGKRIFIEAYLALFFLGGVVSCIIILS